MDHNEAEMKGKSGKFGLLGEHLGHSYSPRIHAALYGMPYECYEKAPEEVAAFLAETDLDGINVTIPYKQTVMDSCVWISETARRIGCVNTLVRGEDGWHGYNTDYDGFCAMLREAGIDPAGRKALILGNGGASLTARTALRDLGASEVVVISRKALPEIRETGGCIFRTESYDHPEKYRDAAVIVNTTPVGMYPENGEILLDPADFSCCEAVADVIYNPARTALLMRAEECGIPCTGGLHMLVSQAKRSAELWLDREIPDPEVTRIRRVLESDMQNIILIGMPGCGKTAVGQALAELSGRAFIDTDEEVKRRTGREIPGIFAAEGEDGFRRYETQVLAEAGKQSGCVIATGGGCVTREENYPLLHQNGRIVWLHRDLKQLPSAGRPLSRMQGMEEMYAARKDAYKRFADLTAENDDTPEAVAARILGMLQTI